MVGTARALVRAEVVDPLDVEALDIRQGDELVDVDGVGGDDVERFQLVGGERDVLALGELVALYAVFPLNYLPIGGADILLTQPRAVLAQVVEANGVGIVDRGEQLAGNRHQAERDRGGCHGTGGHATSPLF